MAFNKTPRIPFQKLLTKSVPKRPARRGAIDLNFMDYGVHERQATVRTQDVRFLCVALKYQYMFENPVGELTIDRRWAAAFSLTCDEIDVALGSSTHGFCWRMLTAESGIPNWMWSLAPEYDHRLLVVPSNVRLNQPPKVEIAPPAIDPTDSLRQTIQAIVDRGLRRARNADLGAVNDPVYGPGELQ